MSIMTFVLCIVLIGTLSVGGDPTVSVTGVIALFGVLITGLFVFMTFRIDRGARYEAQAVAQKAITQALREARTTAKRTAKKKARTVARKKAKTVTETIAETIAKKEARTAAKQEFDRLWKLAAREPEKK